MSKRPNAAVVERGKKALRAIQPEQECEDPYVVSILIGLAQEQVARGQPDHVVWVVSLDGPGAEALYIYWAEISAAFLRKLERP